MTEIKRTVYIEKGNEYRIKTDLQSNDLFEDQYLEALEQLKDIVGPLTNGQKPERLDEQNNNIIVFDGERGQGKSSAMRTFVNIIDKSRNDTAKQFLKRNNVLFSGINFEILKTIDPSNFEKYNSVLNTVVANMYVNIKEKWDVGQSDQSVIEQYRKIMTLFEKAYESLALINHQEKSEKFDYDNGIEKIARVHQSDTLADTLKALIEEYLSIIGGAKKESCLVIPIDDLDTYIAKSYSLVDEIRKYLILPNVVIVLACKVDQLTRGAERHFQEELKSFKANEAEVISECRDMAVRYIDKVLPLARRITLPKLASFERSSIQLVYGESQGLSDEMENKLLDDQTSLSDTFIRLITKKTGIRFYETEENTHPIVPETLRKIVDLTVLLARMEDCLDDNGRIIDMRIYKKNMIKFKEYFIFNYIENSLNNSNKKLGHYIGKVNPMEINQRLSYELLKRIDKSDDYSVYEAEAKKEIMENLRSIVKESETKELWPLGDTITMINSLTFLYTDQVNQELKFLLTTLLTFSAHELAMISNASDTSFEGRSPFFNFYNNSLFGEKIQYTNTLRKPISFVENIDLMINQKRVDSSLLPRTKFDIDYAAVLTELMDNKVAKNFLGVEDEKRQNGEVVDQSENKLSQVQAVTLLSLFIYHNDDFSNDLVASNNAYIGINTATFVNTSTETKVSLEALFVNFLDLKGIATRYKGKESEAVKNVLTKIMNDRESIQLKNKISSLMLNYELLQAYQLQMIATRNKYLRGGIITSEAEYYQDFLVRTFEFTKGKEFIFPEINDSTEVSDNNATANFKSLITEILGLCLSHRKSDLKDEELTRKYDDAKKIILATNTKVILKTDTMVTRLGILENLIKEYQNSYGSWDKFDETIKELNSLQNELAHLNKAGADLSNNQRNEINKLAEAIREVAVTERDSVPNDQRGK